MAEKKMKKEWKNSWTRRIALLLSSYIVIVMIMFEGKIIQPLINAIVPSVLLVIIAVYLYPLTKKQWERCQQKK